MNCKAYVLFGLMFFLFCGCGESPEDRTVSVAIEGSSAEKAQLESLLKSNPVIKGRSGIEYKLKIIEINPSIDYKMIIKPTDDIDYKIIVIDPETKEEISKLSPEIRDGVSKLLEQMKDRQKK